MLYLCLWFQQGKKMFCSGYKKSIVSFILREVKTYQFCDVPIKPLSRIKGSVLGAVVGTTFITHRFFSASSKAWLNPPNCAFISNTFLSMLKGGEGSSSPGLFGWSENIWGDNRDQYSWTADFHFKESAEKNSAGTPIIRNRVMHIDKNNTALT